MKDLQAFLLGRCSCWARRRYRRIQVPGWNVVLFRINCLHAAALAKNLLPLDNPTPSTVIPFPEESSPLHALLHFISPVRQPALQDCAFEAMERLAFAAEKYQVHTVMNICYLYMKYAHLLPALSVNPYSCHM